ncbi:MAG: hypothetical protein Q9216_001101 [Gyalolechia sp. 2 TL-2023]
MSASSPSKPTGGNRPQQAKGSKGARTIPTEMISTAHRELGETFHTSIQKKSASVQLSVISRDYSKLIPLNVKDSSGVDLVIGSVQASRSLPDDFFQAIESVQMGREGIEDEVKKTFGSNRWYAMVNMTKAIMHTEPDPLEASERIDFARLHESHPPTESKWFDIVEIFSSSSADDAVEKEEETINVEMGMGPGSLDLTSELFPLETIELYRTIIRSLTDADPESGKDLKELKRSANFSDRLLCGLFVVALIYCQPKRCMQILNPDHLDSEDWFTGVGSSSDDVASEEGDESIGSLEV